MRPNNSFVSAQKIGNSNSNRMKQTNKQQQITPHRCNIKEPTNNKTNPQPVMATIRKEQVAQAPCPPLPQAAVLLPNRDSGQQQNVFIASPGFSSCCRPSFPALCLASSCPVSLFPLLLSSPFRFLYLAPTQKTQQWSEHANAELRSQRRRSFNRFLRTVRRKRSKCSF